MEKAVESFEWLTKKPSPPPGIKGGYLKIVAKTKANTVHGKDTRVFLPEELQENSRSLIGRPLSFNHKDEISNSLISDSQYNSKEGQLECSAWVPQDILDRVKKKEITHSSIEFSWRETESKDEGIVFHGLQIYGLSLLDTKPGDPGAIVSLYEDNSLKGRINGAVESQEEPKKEEPKKVEVPKVEPDYKKECEQAAITIKTLKENQANEVREAVNKAKSEVIKDIKNTIPDGFTESRFKPGAKRFVEEIKKIIIKHEDREEGLK